MRRLLLTLMHTHSKKRLMKTCLMRIAQRAKVLARHVYIFISIVQHTKFSTFLYQHQHYIKQEVRIYHAWLCVYGNMHVTNTELYTILAL